MVDTIVFDVDGTLVDSTYHHLLAWSRAFDDVGVRVPSWRLHQCMGMGGDQLVETAAGAVVELGVGDDVRALWKKAYDELIDDVRPLPEAVALLHQARHRGLKVVLATSGNEDHVQRTLEILEVNPEEFPVVTSADVARTKPDGDLISAALDRVGASSGVVVGDTVWDVKAGSRAGVPVIGVLTGGVAVERLREAGAADVLDDVAAISSALPALLSHV